MEIPTGKEELTTIDIWLDCQGLPLTHDKFEIREQDIISPFAGEYIKVGLFVPAYIALTFHWYMGADPPLTGIAVNVTGDPKQNGLVRVEIETPAANEGLTTMVTGFEVAGLPLTQAAVDVNLQVTISPFTGVYVKTELFVPTVIVFLYHWYTGINPPLVGVAVNVTEVPGQTGFAEGEMDMPAGVLELTDMVMAFDLAGFIVAQVRFEVIWQ